MNRFNFLRRYGTARAQIPQMWKPAIAAGTGIAVLLAASYATQSRSLDRELAMEQQYRIAFEHSQVSARSAKRALLDERELLRLQRRLAAIARTGSERAALYSRLANVIPPHTWLTAIAGDGTGLSIEGQTYRLDAIASLLERLSSVHGISAPRLTSITSSTAHRPHTVTFRIRVNGDAGA